MRAGGLNKIVEVWRRSTTTTDFGAKAEAWTRQRHVRANVRRLSGGVEVTALEDFGNATVQVEMHALQVVLLTDRLKFEDAFWRVVDTYVENYPRKRVVKVERINE